MKLEIEIFLIFLFSQSFSTDTTLCDPFSQCLYMKEQYLNEENRYYFTCQLQHSLLPQHNGTSNVQFILNDKSRNQSNYLNIKSRKFLEIFSSIDFETNHEFNFYVDIFLNSNYLQTSVGRVCLIDEDDNRPFFPQLNTVGEQFVSSFLDKYDRMNLKEISISESSSVNVELGKYMICDKDLQFTERNPNKLILNVKNVEVANASQPLHDKSLVQPFSVDYIDHHVIVIEKKTVFCQLFSLKLLKKLDYEQIHQYYLQLSIQTIRSHNEPLHATHTVIVKVQNVVDTPPHVQNLPQHLYISPKTSRNLYQFHSTVEYDKKNSVQYSINDVQPKHLKHCFDITKYTGKLTINFPNLNRQAFFLKYTDQILIKIDVTNHFCHPQTSSYCTRTISIPIIQKILQRNEVRLISKFGSGHSKKLIEKYEEISTLLTICSQERLSIDTFHKLDPTLLIETKNKFVIEVLSSVKDMKVKQHLLTNNKWQIYIYVNLGKRKNENKYCLQITFDEDEKREICFLLEINRNLVERISFDLLEIHRNVEHYHFEQNGMNWKNITHNHSQSSIGHLEISVKEDVETLTNLFSIIVITKSSKFLSTFSSGIHEKHFKIFTSPFNSNELKIRLIRPLDAEKRNHFVFTLYLQTPQWTYSELNIIVNVIDINDNVPIIQDLYSQSIHSNTIVIREDAEKESLRCVKQYSIRDYDVSDDFNKFEIRTELLLEENLRNVLSTGTFLNIQKNRLERNKERPDNFCLNLNLIEIDAEEFRNQPIFIKIHVEDKNNSFLSSSFVQKIIVEDVNEFSPVLDFGQMKKQNNFIRFEEIDEISDSMIYSVKMNIRTTSDNTNIFNSQSLRDHWFSMTMNKNVLHENEEIVHFVAKDSDVNNKPFSFRYQLNFCTNSKMEYYTLSSIYDIKYSLSSLQPFHVDMLTGKLFAYSFYKQNLTYFCQMKIYDNNGDQFSHHTTINFRLLIDSPFNANRQQKKVKCSTKTEWKWIFMSPLFFSTGFGIGFLPIFLFPCLSFISKLFPNFTQKSKKHLPNNKLPPLKEQSEIDNFFDAKFYDTINDNVPQQQEKKNESSTMTIFLQRNISLSPFT
ncbi:hypothetical protein SNEBB_005449 [Seison nebaliae]|nr:hypothetical protein SNEBB_005449 [Seison nebaliae]